jgi:hypothetical protein
MFVVNPSKRAAMSQSADRCIDKATTPQTRGSLGAVEEQVSCILPHPREERVVR